MIAWRDMKIPARNFIMHLNAEAIQSKLSLYGHSLYLMEEVYEWNSVPIYF